MLDLTYHVVAQEELSQLSPGELVQRAPTRQWKYLAFQKLKDLSKNGDSAFMGTWEELFMEEDGTAVLIRRDEWPHMGSGLSRDAARRLFLGE